MINLAPPIFMVNGLTIMRDDVDPLQYYYYPNNPQLALNPDGTPTFLLVKFKNNAPVPRGAWSRGAVSSTSTWTSASILTTWTRRSARSARR